MSAACPPEDLLVALAEGALPQAERADLHEHLDRCPSCRDVVAELARCATPQRDLPLEFDEYRLIRRIGAGAMGEVYLAEDTLLQRQVAIKWITAPLPDDQERSRFLAEARAIARLSHPNVVSIYRVGQVVGRRYLVSEYVPGESLDQVARPVSWQKLVLIAQGLSRGLAAAHRRGVLHRDVKPANALCTPEGEVKLVDFGLARLIGTPEPTRLLCGTPLYMAPEIWRGEEATAASDVYSLGALLYELASGAPPHVPTGGDPLGGLRQAALARDAPPLAPRAPGLAGAPCGPSLCGLIDRCLRRAPGDRFPSAIELSEALAPLSSAIPGELAGGNPYRGLHSFEPEHHALFFGRAEETRQVVELLRREPLVVVAGDSGTGKSSLCRAGVLSRYPSVLTLLPGQRPLRALAHALAPLLSSSPTSPASPASIEGLLANDPEALLGQLGARDLLLFIDQAEELWTQSDPAEAERVGRLLLALTLPRPRVRALLCLRADFLTRLTGLLGSDTLHRALYLLPPLSADGLRDAIVEPARRAGVTIESEALVQELVRSALSAQGGLPLLGFTLSQLWERRDVSRGVVTAQALSDLGGVAGALSRHADAVLARMAAPEQAAARRLLGKLVTPEGFAVRRPAAELLGAPPSPAATAALEALVRGRVVVARQEAYELAHETLLRGWGTLRDFLTEDRERRLLSRRLEGAAAEWQRLERPGDALWGPRQLAEAALLDPEDLALRERAFLGASRRALRWRRLRAPLAAALLVLLGAGVYGGTRLKVQREVRARVAAYKGEAQTLLAEAQSLRAQAEGARDAALGHFRARRREAGEQAWAQALASGAQVEARYRRSAHALELALALDPDQPALRRRLGELVFTWAEWAEGPQGPQGQHRPLLDLLDKLALYDQDQSLHRRWGAPATLHLRSAPGPARVQAAPYVSDPATGRRVLGTTRDLGPTPLREVKLAPGSYLLTLSPQAGPALPYPVLLRRGETLALDIALPATAPRDMVYIAAGRSLFGSAADEEARLGWLQTVPLMEVHTGPFLIARHETTFAAWIDFLRALPAAERARRAPRGVSPNGSVELSEQPDGSFALTLGTPGGRYQARMGEPLRYQGRLHRAEQDWLRFPVSGVSCADARAYAAWLDQTGRVRGARLCTEEEWERAARGADEREFPHGDRLQKDDANIDVTYGLVKSAFGPDEVGSHPASRSPFGVEDLSGNINEWVASSLGPGCVIRGGAYYYGELTARVPNRSESEESARSVTLGVRVCASPSAQRPW